MSELVRNRILPGSVYFVLKEYNLISNLELKEYTGERYFWAETALLGQLRGGKVTLARGMVSATRSHFSHGMETPK